MAIQMEEALRIHWKRQILYYEDNPGPPVVGRVVCKWLGTEKVPDPPETMEHPPEGVSTEWDPDQLVYTFTAPEGGKYWYDWEVGTWRHGRRWDQVLREFGPWHPRFYDRYFYRGGERTGQPHNMTMQEGLAKLAEIEEQMLQERRERSGQ